MTYTEYAKQKHFRFPPLFLEMYYIKQCRRPMLRWVSTLKKFTWESDPELFEGLPTVPEDPGERVQPHLRPLLHAWASLEKTNLK